jgi:acetyl esterase/lipase
MEGRQDPEWVKVLASKKLVYSISWRRDVHCCDCIPYVGDGSQRFMDVYTPSDGDTAQLHPAILFVHGGPIPANLATLPKDWKIFRDYGQQATAVGLAGVTFNHRLFDLSSYSDAAEDVRDAVKYVRANAEFLRIDKNSLCLWFFSGAGLLMSTYLREAAEYVRCLVAYYAVFDCSDSLFGNSAPDEAFSPAAQLKLTSARLPPIFIARAGLDRPELNVTIDAFLQEALAKNVAVDFANHPTGHHGFDVEDDNERSREIIRRTFDFVVKHIAGLK